MTNVARRDRWSWIVGVVLLAGCAGGTPLMPAPVLYTGPQGKPLFDASARIARTPPLELVYITDRAARSSEQAPQGTDVEDALPYGADRSPSMAFGTVVVEFGENVDWDTLAAQSIAMERTVDLELKLGTTTELGRFPRLRYRTLPLPGGRLKRDPAVVAAHRGAADGLRRLLAERIAAAPRKELVLFVHGYANTFEDAAFRMGELCHFLGRELACAIFTWPAGGSRGFLFGYNVDRESSEYAVVHLRQTLRIVAGTPGLERMHLIAHSRGTDVLLSALQQLVIEHYAARVDAFERLKLRNIVLAAPDIDMEVAGTKLFTLSSDPDLLHGDRPEPDAPMLLGDLKLTIYASPDDSALGFAEALFGSLRRLGRIDAKTFDERALKSAETIAGLDVIDIFGSTDAFGHSYFTSDPRVSADLIALIRYGLKPGEPGRPLDEVRRPFWRIRKANP